MDVPLSCSTDLVIYNSHDRLGEVTSKEVTFWVEVVQALGDSLFRHHPFLMLFYNKRLPRYYRRHCKIPFITWWISILIPPVEKSFHCLHILSQILRFYAWDLGLWSSSRPARSTWFKQLCSCRLDCLLLPSMDRRERVIHRWDCV